ncbi:AEC family transporter [Geomesophilobacter sediminis]|uniref:AEC family transporter n=1 Tax=Geomesophilobacter sediminis TaxID=2798584 RepID=A0A8J7J7H2_9BACT|nr:AEC family transporter [Geomesophilobacter sediminis]MBJ6725186.1 AEC family transporter [Geomesophilobacter sediminis]
MANIILLAVCLLAGIGLKKNGRFPAATPAALNGFIIHISLPALAVLHIHKLKLDPSLALTAGMAWLLFGCAWAVFWCAGRMFNLERDTLGALILVAGLGNTSFVGLPMIEAYFGKEYLGVGIVADQLGSFMVLSTLGIFVATLYSSGSVSPRQMARKVLMFPPFQALVLALLLRPVPFPEWSVTVLEKLGSTLTPLALVSVGFQLHFGGIGAELKYLLAGLGYKLFAGPALVTLLYLGLLGATETAVRVTVFEAAMAPMITAGIIAIDHELRPQLVGMLVGIGIPLSFVTLHFWHLFLTRI